MLTTSVERLEGTTVKLTVIVPAEDVNAAIRQSYETLGKKMRIPGFRKGKAPRPVVDSHLGKEYVLSEATEAVVESTYPMAVDAENRLHSEPVELEQLSKDDCNHRDRQHVRQEDRPPVEPPAPKGLEQEHGDCERQDDEHGHREQQASVVGERRSERRIRPRRVEIVERPFALVSEGCLRDLEQRIAEDEQDDSERRCDPDEGLGTAEPVTATATAANGLHGEYVRGAHQEPPVLAEPATGCRSPAAPGSISVSTVATDRVSSTPPPSRTAALPRATLSARLPGGLVHGSVRRK